ncbi:hypothetical protein AALP_AA3G329300 [Arabis alpina]|uniref:NAC domain-containing protein n=1 Tax=Arabis alpina TaxID=50452 RepID=A0A087HD89_ARAAL|nr:hypothetical protein AALP_AA3G329300 [Arabis alpina]
MSKEINLPGFRFHPTEEELLDFYLKNMVYGKMPKVEVIGFLNIYRHDPWDLPLLSRIGEREWYFFVPRERKYGNGGRPSRITEKGYWKATGSDRKIISLSEPKRVIGLKKTLVFYRGRAPGGSKTDWVMNEFRMPDNCPLPKDVVLCKIYRKATSLKVLEQRAEMEAKMNQNSPLSSSETISFVGKEEDLMMTSFPYPQVVAMKEDNNNIMLQDHTENAKNQEKQRETERKESSSSVKLPCGVSPLPELQLPKAGGPGLEWGTDQWLSISPWLQNLTPIVNLLNF